MSVSCVRGGVATMIFPHKKASYSPRGIQSEYFYTSFNRIHLSNHLHLFNAQTDSLPSAFLFALQLMIEVNQGRSSTRSFLLVTSWWKSSVSIEDRSYL